jgi:hypothetical protein
VLPWFAPFVSCTNGLSPVVDAITKETVDEADGFVFVFVPVAAAPIAPVHAAPCGQHATCPAWSAEQTAVRGQQSPGAPRPAQLYHEVAHALPCRLSSSMPLSAGDVSIASYTGVGNGATAGSKSAKTSGAARAASGASSNGVKNVRIVGIWMLMVGGARYAACARES